MSDQSNSSTSKSTKILAISTIFLAIATLALAIFAGTQTTALVNQSNIMQKDFDANNRPWIGADEIKVYDDRIVYDYKNYGKIPNTGGTVWALATQNKPTKDDIISDRSDISVLHVMMPSQKLSSPLISPELNQAISDARDKKLRCIWA